MSQFYTSSEEDLRRCRASLIEKRPILITATVDDKIRAFNGVVQSVDEDRKWTPKRWRITIIESQ
jgi:hypothetical protein